MTGTATTRDIATTQTTRARKHVHHGRTPAAWTGSLLTFVGFAVGSWGVVVASWPLIGIGALVVVVALLAVVAMRAAGLGAD